MTACMKIHRGTVLKKEPALHGLLDTFSSQFKTKFLTKKKINIKPIPANPSDIYVNSFSAYYF